MNLYKLALLCREHAARLGVCLLILGLLPSALSVQEIPKVEQVELQPFVAQVKRLAETMDYLGTPLSLTDKQALEKAANETDAARAVAAIQNVLDKHCLVDVHINPESRVKVTQGPARAELLENGWRSFLVKVRNEAGVTAQLVAESPNALPVFSVGIRGFSFEPRPTQTIT